MRLAVGITAPALISFSMVLSYKGASIWSGIDDATFDIRAAGIVAIDIAKCMIPIIIIALWRLRKYATSSVLALVLLCASLASIQATHAVMTTGRSDALAAQQIDHDKLSDHREEKKRLTGELATYASISDAATLRAEQQALEHNRRWATSKQCTDATAVASRKLCADHARLSGQIASAKTANTLRERITSLTGQIKRATTTSAVSQIGVDLTLLQDVFGLSRSQAIGARPLIVAILIEMLGITFVTAYGALSQRRSSVTVASALPTVTQPSLSTPGGSPQRRRTHRRLRQKTSVTIPSTPQRPSLATVDGQQIDGSQGGSEATGEQTLTAFLSDDVVPCPGGALTSGDLYQAYKDRCANDDVQPASQKRFGLAVQEIEGVKRHKSSGKVLYRNIAFASAAVALPNA